MDRRPTTQDITWLLDLERNSQLDLDPPYQRRSVWTRKDRQFFLDTVFRNFPSPAIFLHKSMTDDGAATYHVVDGKQRLQTILQFVKGKLRIARDFGDLRLDGKKWEDLVGDTELKHRFWNYQITVEMLDDRQVEMVREVFDRLNRNARRLTDQELRHAKYEGWLISTTEAETEREEWRELGVTTRARSTRMVDSQFISELILVVLENKVLGFDQDALDGLYAKYDDLTEVDDFPLDDFRDRFERTKAVLLVMERHNTAVTRWARGFGAFYTLWALIALHCNSKTGAGSVAERYAAFMQQVDELSQQTDLESFLRQDEVGRYRLALRYVNNARGASTDLAQRQARLDALREAVLPS
jgi:hypothetical protein